MKGSQKDFDQDLSHKRTLSRCRHCLSGPPIFGPIWQQWKASRQAFPIILNCYNVIVYRWHRIQATFDVWKSMQSFGCCQCRCVLKSLDLRFLRFALLFPPHLLIALDSTDHNNNIQLEYRGTALVALTQESTASDSYSLHSSALGELCRCATPLRTPLDLEAPP